MLPSQEAKGKPGASRHARGQEAIRETWGQGAEELWSEPEETPIGQ